jgi:mRNA interferase MazF
MRRGEIYFVDLDPVIGREQAGRRPVVVVSIEAVNRLPLVVIVVPGTDGSNIRRDHPTNVRVPASESGRPAETVFLCFQVRAVDPRRFPARPTGQLTPAALTQVEEALRYCLGL